MHIPDSMLLGSICPVTAIISAVGIIAGSYYALNAKNKPTASYFGAITALIFAGQMMNFPIMNGTSGHLLGGVLAASLLGTPFGILAMALVVSIQSLVFSDGGITVLGANIFNMAIIGAGAGGMIRSKLARQWKTTLGAFAATAVAAWLSVILASLAVSVELAMDGQIAFSTVAPAMLSTHALIGIGEAIIIVVCCLLFPAPVHSSVATETKKQVAVPLTAAVLVALLFSPFASKFPDGLEGVAEKYEFMHASAPAFVAPLSDYAFPWLSNEMLSMSIAGLIGVILAYGVAWSVSRIMQMIPTKNIV
ncbi:MAG: energy-coupling factor ABC transporter permease [Gallionellaceae bacterium]|jgi:cobalt/nickel transport system permease protein